MSKKDAVSASTIGTSVISGGGSHVLRIKGYSQTMLLGTGARALSCVFEAAGQWWRISYYPNGSLLTSDGHSISLALEVIGSKHNRPEGYVNAVALFTLLPNCSKLPADRAPPHSVRLSRKFCVDRERCFRFIRREELEKSEGYLVDDCFAVRCDIDVVKTWASWDRVEDVVETTETMGLVWRSAAQEEDLRERRRASGPVAAAWPFAGLRRFLHRLFNFFP